MSGIRWSLGLAAVVVAACLPGRAAADDWLQFRHDDRRTAVSRDRLQVPLTDVWTRTGYGTATWHGRAFYLGQDGIRGAVFCADLRTGATLWKRPLSFRQNEIYNQWPLQLTPIAVSSDGVVYVQDSHPLSHGVSFPKVVGDNAGVYTAPFGHVPRGMFRTFRATDGTPLAAVSSPPADVPVQQVLLTDGTEVVPSLLPPVLRGLVPTGPVLLQGNEVTATSFDGLFRWTPGGLMDLLSLAHPRPPVPNDLGLRDVSMGGFPPTNSGSGILVGGMAWIDTYTGDAVGDKQFLAHMRVGKCTWKRVYPWSLGYPTVDKGLVLTGAGGKSAREAVMAHDIETGAVRWVYPRDGLRPDHIGLASQGGGLKRALAADPHVYIHHAGVAVSGDRAYAAVGNSIVALNVGKGEPVWSWTITGGPSGEPSGEWARSLVLTPDHLLVSLDGRIKNAGSVFQSTGRLVALRLSDGKPEWSQPVPRGGELALSDGVLFLSDESVHAFAPAERTYRMAVDSARPEDYDPLPGLNREPPEPQPDAKRAAAPKPPPGVADASVVRLYWGEPEASMLQQLRERRAAAPGLPLLVSLDWLDPTRTTIRGGQTGWSPREIAAFADLCARLAREVRPEHLDLAPEVNVYLSRDTRWLTSVRALLQASVKAVKQASPATKVLVSFNREVLARKYGRGNYTPFGKTAFSNRDEQKSILSLFNEVDEVGLTSIPQSAFTSPLDIPGDYLLDLKATLPKKPLLITRLAMQWDPSDKTPEFVQAAYLKHLIQAAYWINAELVAYPELTMPKRTLGDPAPLTALRVEGEERLALAYWRDTLQWKRVERLSAPAAEFGEKGLP